MREEEWLECTDPAKMLLFLQGKTSSRKLALFALACCRRVWHILPEHRHGRELIEASEQFLDGQEAAWTAIETRYGPEDGWDWYMDCHRIGDPAGAAVEAAHTSGDRARQLAQETAKSAALVVEEAAQYAAPKPPNAVRLTGDALLNAGRKVRETAQAARREEEAVQCRLLDDLFGPLPFGPVSVSQSWLTDAVVGLARQMYEVRDFRQMPLLGEALKQSGCRDTVILNHCCQAREHVRGCWVVDLLLGKE